MFWKFSIGQLIVAYLHVPPARARNESGSDDLIYAFNARFCCNRKPTPKGVFDTHWFLEIGVSGVNQ